jgi:hypothetical protein
MAHYNLVANAVSTSGVCQPSRPRSSNPELQALSDAGYLDLPPMSAAEAECRSTPDAWQARRGVTAGKFDVFLSARQRGFVEQYLRCGSASWAADGGAGKTFAMAYIAALELEQGCRVSYRTGLGEGWRCSAEWFRDHVKRMLGNQVFAQVQHERRLLLPRMPHDVRGCTIDVDLRDEAFAGCDVPALDRARRWAEAGRPWVSSHAGGWGTAPHHSTPLADLKAMQQKILAYSTVLGHVREKTMLARPPVAAVYDTEGSFQEYHAEYLAKASQPSPQDDDVNPDAVIVETE